MPAPDDAMPGPRRSVTLLRLIASRAPRRLAKLAGDRRGITSIAFGITAVAILGLAGLGTEAGAWYVLKQRGQNTADAAAVAGAMALALDEGSTGAIATATDVAGRNGYSNGGAVSVTVNTPPASGPNASNASAVEVIIGQQQTPLFSALFLNAGPLISTRAVAAVEDAGTACALALGTGSGLAMGGNSTTAAKGCTLASNASGSQSLYIYGSATVSAYTLHTAGGCAGCSGSGVSLTRPASAYQLPTTNPFAAADNATLPNFSNCTAVSGTITLTPYETSGSAYCGFSAGSQQTITLTPGTYFFTGNIALNGGSALICPTCTGGAGVTLVMTGLNGSGNAGSLNIDGHASVNLAAPVSNQTNAAFDGMLFYQDGRGSPGSVTINGGATTTLSGGLYFPGAAVTFDGNEDMNGNGLSTCTELVAMSLDISGNASTTLDTSGCAQYGTKTAQLQAVRLLE
jgi:Flp pilus assembly protein TadG